MRALNDTGATDNVCVGILNGCKLFIKKVYAVGAI